jgi:hypothetical protein
MPSVVPRNGVIGTDEYGPPHEQYIKVKFWSQIYWQELLWEGRTVSEEESGRERGKIRRAIYSGACSSGEVVGLAMIHRRVVRVSISMTGGLCFIQTRWSNFWVRENYYPTRKHLKKGTIPNNRYIGFLVNINRELECCYSPPSSGLDGGKSRP